MSVIGMSVIGTVIQEDPKIGTGRMRWISSENPNDPVRRGWACGRPPWMEGSLWTSCHGLPKNRVPASSARTSPFRSSSEQTSSIQVDGQEWPLLLELLTREL